MERETQHRFPFRPEHCPIYLPRRCPPDEGHGALKKQVQIHHGVKRGEPMS